ncbi:MAG: hypothetical protein JOY71_03790 [Acetobacteraceae bacterium]|nr:hypothetical protein [Acetobacteraceae bacterium]
MWNVYSAVMDPSVNPLRKMPVVQRFQTMLYLGIMWTVIFCAAAGAWLWFGELLVAHVLVALGFLLTGLTFHRASHGNLIAAWGGQRSSGAW